MCGATSAVTPRITPSMAPSQHSKGHPHNAAEGYKVQTNLHIKGLSNCIPPPHSASCQECKYGICASGWMEKHHQCKLLWVKPPCVQVESLCQHLRENHHHISCCQWQPPQAQSAKVRVQGAKVRPSSSASQSGMQQQHATPTTTTTTTDHCNLPNRIHALQVVVTVESKEVRSTHERLLRVAKCTWGLQGQHSLPTRQRPEVQKWLYCPCLLPKLPSHQRTKTVHSKRVWIKLQHRCSPGRLYYSITS